METKICRKCEKEKNINEYRITKVNNKEYIINICKECERQERNEYVKNVYYKKNKDKILGYQREYRKTHKENLKEYYKKYYEKNKENKKEKSKEYRLKHKKEINKKIKEKAKSDYAFAFKCTIRKMLNRSFTRKKYTKNGNLEEIVGLNADRLVKYLLQTFKNNYGYEWDKKEKVHIDHIIPLATAQNQEEVARLCHYSNLQLLKAKDNIEKGAKIV